MEIAKKSLSSHFIMVKDKTEAVEQDAQNKWRCSTRQKEAISHKKQFSQTICRTCEKSVKPLQKAV